MINSSHVFTKKLFPSKFYRYLSSQQVSEKLRKLTRLQKYDELHDEIKSIANNMEIKQSSLTVIIPKVCVRINDIQLAHDILELFEEQRTAKYNSNFSIGCSQLVKECLDSNMSFSDVWSCYRRVRAIDGHLDKRTFQGLLTKCAQELHIQEMLQLVNHHTYYEMSLILTAEPLIISDHLPEYMSLFKRFLLDTKSTQPSNLHNTARIINRVIKVIYLARIKRCISHTHMKADHEQMDGFFNLLAPFLEVAKVNGMSPQCYHISLSALQLINLERAIGKMRKTGQLEERYVYNPKMALEVTGFSHALEDRDLFPTELASTLIKDITADPLSRDTADTPHFYSTAFVEMTGEEEMARNGLSSGYYRFAAEYYGSQAAYPSAQSQPSPHANLAVFDLNELGPNEDDDDEEDDDDDDDDLDSNDDDDDDAEEEEEKGRKLSIKLVVSTDKSDPFYDDDDADFDEDDDDDGDEDGDYREAEDVFVDEFRDIEAAEASEERRAYFKHGVFMQPSMGSFFDTQAAVNPTGYDKMIKRVAGLRPPTRLSPASPTQPAADDLLLLSDLSEQLLQHENQRIMYSQNFFLGGLNDSMYSDHYEDDDDEDDHVTSSPSSELIPTEDWYDGGAPDESGKGIGVSTSSSSNRASKGAINVDEFRPSPPSPL